MITAAQTRQLMECDPRNWIVPLMDFVDDLRYRHDPAAITEPFVGADPRRDALLAAVIETLCRELHWETPLWVVQVPPSPKPWFVSGLQQLKAIALVESPLPFRIRRIFVLENFLHRV